jgi:hypothetical protein
MMAPAHIRAGAICFFLKGFQIYCLGSLGIGLFVERDFLAFAECAHARRFKGRGMNKDILAAAFGCNKTKTFVAIEEFYCSDGH